LPQAQKLLKCTLAATNAINTVVAITTHCYNCTAISTTVTKYASNF